jgi:glycosyltransferase involved in cell wall biosynthesis
MGLENVAAAAGLLGDLADVRIVVAGGGQPREFERLARDAGVELLGRVPDDLLPAWHRAADLFLLPTIAYEGFGLVTAEALASGTPVVGTPVGATPDLLEPLEPRLVASGTDARALAKAVRTGLELATPELRRRCRSYALERLSWTTVLPAWERALEAASRTGRVPVRAPAVSDLPDRT